MSAESEARRALARLGRAVAKAEREVSALEGALRTAESDDFPRARYAEVRELLSHLEAFAREEGERLQEKILTTGGLEPGRVRRSSSTGEGGVG